MKIQNPSMHDSQDTACIKKRDGRMDGRTTRKQYAPSTSSKLGA